MSNKGIRYAGLLSVAFLLCAGFSIAQAEDSETILIKGKPLAKWIKQLQHKNRGLQVRAARYLSEVDEKLRPRIVPEVVPLLTAKRMNTRAWAAQTLGNYGPVARAGVKDLIPMLKGTQYERNRTAAAKALGLILIDAKHDEEVEKATLALTAKFNEDYDKYSDVRREAVRSLGMIGPAAKSCIPKLTRGLTDYRKHSNEHAMVRSQAAWTCGRMGPLAKEHIDRLISMMHKEGDRMPNIVWAIGEIGPIHENVIPNVIDKLEKSSQLEAFSFRAIEALGKFGTKASPAADLLKLLLKRADRHVSGRGLLAIMRALKGMDQAARSSVAVDVKRFANLKSHRGGRGAPPATPEQLAEIRAIASELSAGGNVTASASKDTDKNKKNNKKKKTKRIIKRPAMAK